MEREIFVKFVTHKFGSSFYLDSRESDMCVYDRVGYISFNRGGFHRDPRQIVQYKDLDAPDDADAFWTNVVILKVQLALLSGKCHLAKSLYLYVLKYEISEPKKSMFQLLALKYSTHGKTVKYLQRVLVRLSSLF